MKRRIIAVAAAMPIVLAMIITMHGASFASALDEPDSLVEVTQCTLVGAPNLSAAGRPASFLVTVSIPANLSADQFKGLTVTISQDSAFTLSGPMTSYYPFADRIYYTPSTVATLDSFRLDLIYTGSGNSLVFSLSHPLDGDIASSEFGPFFASQADPSPELTSDLEPLPPPEPDFGATPRLSLSGSIPSLEAGKVGNVNFTLTNNSPHSARGVTVALEGTEELFRPMTLSGYTATVGDMRLSGSTRTRNVSIPVDVLSDVKQGFHSIILQISMRNPAGATIDQTISFQVYIRNPVSEDAPSESSLSLVSATISDSNPDGDGLTTLTLTIANIGEGTASNARMTLTGFVSSVITLNENSATKPLGNIASGAQATVTYSVRVASVLESGSYALNVEVRYRQPDNSEGSMTAVANVNINRPEEEEEEDPPEDPENPNTSVPRVIISKHALSADTVNAGSPFELSFTLLNTSASMNVGNMQVTVSDTNGIFIPVEGVSSFYIQSLPNGQTTDITVVLMPRQDAETKSHPLTVAIEYEDAKFNPHTVTAIISIPVIMPQRLEVTNVAFFDNGMGMAELSFQFINKGMAALHNLNVRIDGPMTASEGDFFVGQFAPGQSDYFEDMIWLDMFGEVTGEIVLEFEDSSGAPHELRHPISTFIGEPFMPDFDFDWDGDSEWMEENGDGSEGSGWPEWVVWVSIGGSALVGIVIATIIVKRVRRKKREFLDDDAI